MIKKYLWQRTKQPTNIAFSKNLTLTTIDGGLSHD